MSNVTLDKSQTIQVRYAEEATTSCCLSCGGAIDYAKPEKGEVLIDLGSGRGLDVLKAARMVETAYGIDFTKEMINASVSNKKKLRLENAHFLEGKIDQIPLPNESADVVISNCTINHAPNKQAVYSEIYRVLKKGGRFVVSDIIVDEKLPDHIINDPNAWAACYGGAIPESDYFEAIYKSGFRELEVIEKSESYQKVEVMVRSITIKAYKK
ncbi:MAG: methyltransferase domain-containing protein [Leptospiraceae bacterium]|nr:methyltransferase domain-containing protein [Leptospiraceae bacterium]MCP5495396.1 methyltransferase domain-containing protein [Leptospiraceae bacterium]